MSAARMTHVRSAVFVAFVAFVHYSQPLKDSSKCRLVCVGVYRLSWCTSDAVGKQWFRSVCRHWSHSDTAHDTSASCSATWQRQFNAFFSELLFRRFLCLVNSVYDQYWSCELTLVQLCSFYFSRLHFISLTTVEGTYRVVFRSCQGALNLHCARCAYTDFCSMQVVVISWQMCHF